MLKRLKLLGITLLALISTLVFLNADEGKPKVIRIAGVGNAYGRPYAAVSPLLVAQVHGLIEEEFEADGIKIEWNILKGVGPAINEAFANKTVDFTCYGDLPVIVGKSGGLPLKIVGGNGGGMNIYIIVPADSSVKTLADLKGKRIGVTKGTYMQLTLAKVLAARGWTEKDFKVYNLGQADGIAAIGAKSIDAYVASNGALDQVKLGVAKIIYDTRQDPYDWRGTNVFTVTEDFAKKYPDITRRLLKQIVKAAHWASQPENRREFLQIAAKAGVSVSNLIEDYGQDSLKDHSDPTLSKAYRGQLQAGIDFAKTNGYIRKSASVDDWIDDSYLNAALQELGLEDYWQ
jgi:sulfonate transport system substrate-binding protein